MQLRVGKNLLGRRNDVVYILSTTKGEPMGEVEEPPPEPLYCPTCDREVTDPLVCGDCAAIICRRCGTPLEKVDELGIG